MSEAHLREILLADEYIEQSYEHLEALGSSSRLSITNHRGIVWTSQLDFICDFDRKHLCSIDYRIRNVWIIGLILMVTISVGGLLLSVLGDEVLQGIGFPIAVIGVLIGSPFLFRHESVSFWIVGRPQPIKVGRNTWPWQKKERRLRSLLSVARRSLPGLVADVPRHSSKGDAA